MRTTRKRKIGFERAPTTETIKGYTLFEPGPLLLVDTEVTSAAQGLVMTDNGKHPHLNSRIARCWIHGKPSWKNGEFGNRVDWGVRAYDFSGKIEDTEISDIGSEHALYINPAGNVSVDGCYLHNLGGQAVQFYFRPWESSDPERLGAQAKTLVVLDTIAQQYGRNLSYAERQGFGFTFGDVGPETLVVVNGCYQRVRLKAFKAHGGWWNSYGGIVVQNAVSVVIRGSTVDHRRPDRPIIQVERAGKVTLLDSHVPEGLIDLQLVEWLTVKGCTGGAYVRLRGVPLGQLGELDVDA